MARLTLPDSRSPRSKKGVCTSAALGRLEEAEAAVRRARSEAVAVDAAPPRWRACLAPGDLFQRTGRAEQPAAEYGEARALLEAVATTLSDPELRRSFIGSEPMQRALAGTEAHGMEAGSGAQPPHQ